MPWINAKAAPDDTGMERRQSEHFDQVDAIRYVISMDAGKAKDDAAQVIASFSNAGIMRVHDLKITDTAFVPISDSWEPEPAHPAEVECRYCGCAVPLTRTHCGSCGGPREVVK